MLDANSLTILQYNVRKERIGTMIPLFADIRTQEYDIIAIQEPWYNTQVATSLSAHREGFHLLFHPDLPARVCFYINARIKAESWEVKFLSTDVATLTLQTRCTGEPLTIQVHNVYNPSPTSYSSTDSASNMAHVRNAISAPGQHILLGDFNLHHPYWSGPTRVTQHAAADELIDLTCEFGLDLTLPTGRTTWEARNSTSTIDLVFMSEVLRDRLEFCDTRPELGQSSDHIPVGTTIGLESEAAAPHRRRLWKAIDLDKLKQLECEAPGLTTLRDRYDIEAQAERIQSYLRWVMEDTVPISHGSPYGKSYWSQECSDSVATTRRLRRRWSTTRDEGDLHAYQEANNHKSNVIKRHKRQEFRTQMTALSDDPSSLWRVARWAKDKSHLPREIPKLPPLTLNGHTATTFEEKCEMFKTTFFPPPPEADLADIEGGAYPSACACPAVITEEEVRKALWGSKANKAPGPDEIPLLLLQLSAGWLIPLLTQLFNACATLAYHPRCFREVRTIALKKPGKPDYTTPKAYRPIALLNTLGKALEFIMAKKITHLAEHHDLLPKTHMGARRNRSTESALELLTEQVHEVWGQGDDKVATLLSMDISGAFDTVSHPRLIHNLRKRRIPQWITDWVLCFLSDRTTTLSLHQTTSERFLVRTGIPQGSPISPILYLFYNADLLDICNRQGTKVSGIGFVDDVNLLAFSTSTEENCRTLARLHTACETWARRHGSVWAPQKYELIHLTRRPKRFNMQATLTLNDADIAIKTDVRVLGLQIDTKLRWGPHIRKVQQKMTRQTLALTKISTSTWGASFLKARRVYSAVVRPALTFGSAIWHTPTELKGPKSIGNKLSIIQNRCLRTIAGAYKATPIAVLEAETLTPPINTYLDKLQADSRYRMRATGTTKLVRQLRATIVTKLRGQRGRSRRAVETPGDRKAQWHKKHFGDIERLPLTHTPPWLPLIPEQTARLTAVRKQRADHGKATAKRMLSTWQEQWTRYLEAITTVPSIAQSGRIDKTRLKLHAGLMKAESSLTTQIRTEKIGLADFLFKRRVPSVVSPACPCGWPRQTPRHIIMECRIQPDRTSLFTSSAATSYRQLLSDPKSLKVVTTWLMSTGLLRQFSAVTSRPIL